MREETTKALYEACLNAVGVYEAAEITKIDIHLPGFIQCKERLHEAIKLAEREMTKTLRGKQ